MLASATTPDCVNSDGSRCPDSYFTGPLGEDNVLPARAGLLLIEQFGGIPSTWDQKMAGIRNREAAIGRRFDGIQIQYWGGGTWDGVPGMEDPTTLRPAPERWAVDNGAAFVSVTWTPDFTIGQMNSGAADRIWAKAADYWRSFAPARIMLRTFTEFDLPVTYGTSPGPANGDVDYCGAPFQDAWRRMVGIFQRRGARNVGFWFNPGESADPRCVADSYPGDRYVDWVGSDAYNSCATADRSCSSTPLHAGAATFAELFDYRGECASGPCRISEYGRYGARKPFVVGETGTVFDPGDPTRKGDFFRALVPAAKAMKYLRGVSFFDEDVTRGNPTDHNWRVDHPVSEPSALAGFRDMARDPWTNATVAPPH